ncbi:ATPase, T2SS/T4P/T4SS family [Falsiroseomonas tokyonensis]|uniref:ATPase, T2SS/T4P/T4SS family n=1 Tax=Falsiroseomonas tokyonensis TaxID=430521 RepID=A0ABV7C232_9PROT|nr:ATPase, T2SS/T4P/T4SS family [Falsiroseomonas tokyonensis]MBU8541783.1 Flp pilus assembly complex ATPase component TadA [Falsiroseomonas tokyonensis]
MLAGEATLLGLLAPFAAVLARPGTREIVVNRPGRFGVEGDDGWTWHDAPELTFARLDAILTLAASRTSKRVGPDRPSASSVLPGGERIMGARPPAAPPSTITLAIRRRAKDFTPTLEWLEEGGYFAAVPGRGAAWWRRAVEAGRTILVAGAIGSSKTTFAEALIRAVPADRRLVTIEDTPEWMDLPHENWSPLYFDGERRTATDCLQDAMRLRPDWLPFQELRGAEAWAFLRARVVGHPSVTTIHGGDPAAAIEAAALMVRQSPEGRSLEAATVHGLLRQHVDLVAHCARDPYRLTAVMELRS